ncbi:MAG: hypothetical protein LBF05_03760 [Tannerella sp.]|jgi:hypothetical protein|nr:hypothetical protein [Tannerella sp.]
MVFKKFFLVAAIFAASVAGLANVTAENANANGVQDVAAITAAADYNGTVYDLKMNGKSIDTIIPATFTIDDVTGDISGEVIINVGVMGSITLDGNLYTGADGIAVVFGIPFPFTATFKSVTFSGKSVTFTCEADAGIISASFTFTGTKP